ncbi:hypothetical protein [Halioglobus maricola]|uniref:hypothetical protein n=1 Tax=Halioglobus maricola TaxID=2601894 RepID=UPI001F0F50BD|nr:hypothetical protein [Halioglobus maricola]
MASMVALNLNLRITDLDSYLQDRKLAEKNTRDFQSQSPSSPSDARHVLIIDDTVQSGSTLEEVKKSVFELGRDQRVSYGCAYISPAAVDTVDLYFEELASPRCFEWNFMHRPFLKNCCMDIDGVLCVDPTEEQNDDGEKYLRFLRDAAPLVLPTYEVGHLVTSRLEKYRLETEDWLKKSGVTYGELHMLDLPDAATRRALGCHASFKASVYQKYDLSRLFIESEPKQSREIARLSGKPVICTKNQEIYLPSFSPALIQTKTKRFLRKWRRWL